MKTYYIDESGNTGDVKISENDFNGQPVFTLAAVSFKNIDKVKDKVLELKTKFRIQQPELKSGKRFYQSHQEFTYELVLWLNRSRSEYVIEIVDKKSYLVSRLVDFFILPGSLIGEYQEIVNPMKGEVAQVIYSIIPDTILISTHEYTIAPSNEKLNGILHDLGRILDQNKTNNRVKNVLDVFRVTLNKYNELCAETDEVYEYFLQEHDLNKRDQPIAFLSHLPSFCNIYARINSINDKRLSDVEIIHDNQDHFNDLIVEYKEKMEGLSKLGAVPYSEFSDFDLVEKAVLKFSDSKESIGIQVADCIAGFTMRFIKNLINDKENTEIQWKTFCLLQKQFHKNNSLGTVINCPELIREDIFHYCNHGITLTNKLLKLQERHRNGYSGF